MIIETIEIASWPSLAHWWSTLSQWIQAILAHNGPVIPPISNLPASPSHSATGCELSRQWHLPVVALGSVPDIARGAGAGGSCVPMRRHVVGLLGGFPGWRRDGMCDYG